MKAVCYYRFSTANKAQWDNSEKRQQSSCTQHCRERGWPIVDEVTDMAKSGLLDKPNLIDIKKRCMRGDLKFDVLVVDDAARLSRKNVLRLIEDIGWIDDFGIKIQMVSNGGEPLTFEELGQDPKLILDQWANNRESGDTSRKVTNGMVDKFRDGRLGWCGQTPLGYDLQKYVDGPSTLKANKDLKVVQKVFKHILKGGSIRDAVKYLSESERFKEKQRTSVEVKDPNSTSVKNLLRNPIYCGKRTYGVRNVPKVRGGGVNGDNPKWTKDNPLTMTDLVLDYKPKGFRKAVSYEDWNRVQKILDQNKKTWDGRGYKRKAKHNFHGLLYCGKCGGAMVQDQWRNKRTGEVIYYFVCIAARNHGPRCRDEKPYAKRCRQVKLEERLKLEFRRLFMDEEVHIQIIDQYLRMLEVEGSLQGQREEQITIEVMRERLTKLNRLWMKNQSDALLDSIDELSIEIDKMEKSQKLTPKETSMLEVAKEQWRKGNKEKGFSSYIGRVYATAFALHTGPDDWNDEKIKKRWARKLALSFVSEKGEGTEGSDEGWNSKYSFGEFDNAKVILDMLREMGCTAILIDWVKGERRGKEAWLGNGLRFEFGVGINDHTDICVVVDTNHPDITQLKRRK